jgi:GNAT superfamily N-acetyltransferase
VTRLVRDWRDGTNRFERPGENFFVASDDGPIIGVCGVNVDPYTSNYGTGRLRHLYMHPEYRRRGIGAALVNECRHASSTHFVRLRLRTTNPAAASLYLSMAFVEVDEPDATHAWPQ